MRPPSAGAAQQGLADAAFVLCRPADTCWGLQARAHGQQCRGRARSAPPLCAAEVQLRDHLQCCPVCDLAPLLLPLHPSPPSLPSNTHPRRWCRCSLRRSRTLWWRAGRRWAPSPPPSPRRCSPALCAASRWGLVGRAGGRGPGSLGQRRAWKKQASALPQWQRPCRGPDAVPVRPRLSAAVRGSVVLP